MNVHKVSFLSFFLCMYPLFSVEFAPCLEEIRKPSFSRVLSVPAIESSGCVHSNQKFVDSTKRIQTPWRTSCAAMELGGFAGERAMALFSPSKTKKKYRDYILLAIKIATGIGVFCVTHHTDLPSLHVGIQGTAFALSTFHNVARIKKMHPHLFTLVCLVLGTYSTVQLVKYFKGEKNFTQCAIQSLSYLLDNQTYISLGLTLSGVMSEIVSQSEDGTVMTEEKEAIQ